MSTQNTTSTIPVTALLSVLLGNLASSVFFCSYYYGYYFSGSGSFLPLFAFLSDLAVTFFSDFSTGFFSDLSTSFLSDF